MAFVVPSTKHSNGANTVSSLHIWVCGYRSEQVNTKQFTSVKEYIFKCLRDLFYFSLKTLFLCAILSFRTMFISTLDILGWMVHWGRRGWAMHIISIPGLYPLHARLWQLKLVLVVAKCLQSAGEGHLLDRRETVVANHCPGDPWDFCPSAVQDINTIYQVNKF